MERLMALYNTASPSGREKSMIRLLKAELTGMGITHYQDRKGNLYAVKGRARTYPCVVAHMDEVHRRSGGDYAAHMVDGHFVVGYDRKRKKMAGIGADDKNGIWICLKCLEDFKVMKCAFFVQEETGCIGSGAADMGFFADCRFVLQCDRKGDSDLVTRISGMDLCSEEFIERINPEKYGYQVADGMHTDVYALKRRGLGISCVNISCGYYEPHTDHEYTVLKDLAKCYRLVRHIVCCHKEVSRHTPSPVRRSMPGYYELFGARGYDEELFMRYRKKYVQPMHTGHTRLEKRKGNSGGFHDKPEDIQP